jgi:hypothetical protein
MISALLWVTAHWYLFAALAVLIVFVLAGSSLISFALVIKKLLQAVAAVMAFFLDPPGQRAAKVLCVMVSIGLGISIGYPYGKYGERAEWKEREAHHAAAMEQLRQDAAANADRKVKEAAAAEQRLAGEFEQKVSDYEKQLAAKPAAACGLDDGDLATAGVPTRNPDKNRRAK